MVKDLVVIESPFAGDIEGNVNYARACLHHSLTLGEYPIASHLLYPQVLEDCEPSERKLGIEAGLAWAEKANYAVFYTDKGMSKGMTAALEFYRQKGINVEFRKLKENDNDQS